MVAILGGAASFADRFLLGYAIGAAAGPALAPYSQELANFAWTENDVHPLAAELAAAVAAEDVDAYDAMQTEASYTGYSAARFKNLYGVTLNAPGMGELLAALRRRTITADDFTHGLRKAKLETRWDAALADLQHVRLTPAQLALGIVRSVVDDPGLQVGANDTSGGKVPAYPVSAIDTLAEALAGGVDKERLRVMVGEIGLPMSLQQAASAYFRGIIAESDFFKAVAQGDTRPAWGPFILEQARQILSADQYVEGALRGWIPDAALASYTARHGMSAADTDMLYKIKGRPLVVHQVTTGIARGGTYPSTYDEVPEPYQKAIRESNIRPEWASLAYANRYSYPSAFVLRSLAQAGELGTTADVEKVLLEIGWPPHLAAKVAPSWAPAGTAADTHVSKAQGHLWTRAHSSYLAGEVDRATVAEILPQAGVAGSAVDGVLTVWDAERTLIRKQLTPTQLRKAYSGRVTNPDTGQPWTYDEVRNELIDRGYSPTDATTFLAE